MLRDALHRKQRAGLGLSPLGNLLGAVGLFLGVAVSAAGQTHEGVIMGRVTDARGQPQHVLVRLLADGDILAGDVYTDSNGLFAFRSLPNGGYYVVVDEQGYRPVRQYALLDFRIEPKAQVVIALEPLGKQPKEPSQVIAGSSRSYQLNAKGSSRTFDPKTLREFEKGNQKQRAGNLESAMAHYRKALRIDPDFYPALNNLGTIFERRKNHAEAEATFLHSLEVNPDDAEAYFNLGHALYEEGKYQVAVERLAQGLQRSPRSAVGYFFLGSAYLKLGDLAKAEPNLKEACVSDPAGMGSAHLQLANLYLRRHDVDAASVELETYLKANPSDPQAPSIKKMLANIAAHRAN